MAAGAATTANGDSINGDSSSGWTPIGLASDAIGVFSEDAYGKRVGENAAVFQHLMSGAVKCRRASCPDWRVSTPLSVGP